MKLIFFFDFFTLSTSKSPSKVKSFIGTFEPFTVTLSISRRKFWIFNEQILYKLSEMRIGIPNCFVAASSLDAKFTCGDKYDVSILN